MTVPAPLKQPAQFYDDNILSEQIFDRVYIGFPVNKGDEVRVSGEELTYKYIYAPERGYNVCTFDPSGVVRSFFASEKNFDAKTRDIRAAPLPLPLETLPLGTRITHVRDVTAGELDLHVEVQYPGVKKPQMHGDYYFRTHFHTSVKPTGDYRVAALKDEAPLRGIVVAEGRPFPRANKSAWTLNAESILMRAGSGALELGTPDFVRMGLRLHI